jgi:hypothetical protein
VSEPATSLDRLHDIVPAPAVPWWPPAPGWYVLAGLLLLVGALILIRLVARHRANAYRRAALRELERANDAATIATILRRTALAVAPRSEVAGLHGGAWLDWLEARCRTPMDESARRLLGDGVYDRAAADAPLSSLQDYAARWIRLHTASQNPREPSRC